MGSAVTGVGYRNTERSTIILPPGGKGSRPRGLIYSHGVGQQGALVLVNPAASVDPLTRAGWIVGAADLGNSATFSNCGNDDSIAAMTALGVQLANLGCPVPLPVVGFSMGALLALNWARANPTLVSKLFLICPPLDLNDIYVNNKGGYQATVGTAYGVAYPTALPGLATHSPVAYAPADLAVLVQIPMQLWPSDNDPTASPTASVLSWAATLGPASKTSVHSLGPVGHTDQTIDPGAVVRFLGP